MEVIHFYNGNGGGVLSVIRNLLLYSQSSVIENHVIFTIDVRKKNSFHLPTLVGAKSVRIFYYSSSWNFYYTSKKLNKLIPNEKAILIAHDWLELAVISNTGLNNTVIQFLHSDSIYYYELAKRYNDWIDKFICVSDRVKSVLLKKLPHRIGDIYSLHMPVIDVEKSRTNSETIRIVFAGRSDFAKGYHLLPLINNLLKKNKINIAWNIVGSGTDNNLYVKSFSQSNVNFYGEVSQSELIEIFNNSDIILLPSLMEGTPLVIVEAMKCGVVPIVNNLKGGIQQLVFNSFTGYKINQNSPNGYAERICYLIENRSLLKFMSVKASAYANFHFNPRINTSLIESCFLNASCDIKVKNPRKVIGSRLDHKYIPNFISVIIRNLYRKNG